MKWLSALYLTAATVGIASSSIAADSTTQSAASRLRVALFEVDVTPPVGTILTYTPARSIVDPLSARGIVLLGEGDPIVLCSVDWIGIGNGGHDEWRAALAEAAGTTTARVAVHTVHQHDAPACDFSALERLKQAGATGYCYDEPYSRRALANVAQAVTQSLAQARSITHIGVGAAKVEKVASNRRILGENGKVKIVRFSASRDPEAIAAPEGLIDPMLRLLSFWNKDQPIAVLTYYATHPQSYYGAGDVSCDFVGLARNQRQAETNIPHIHFIGASGNIAAGKYNDGSPEMRPVLARRLADGMERAWRQVERTPITSRDVAWTVEPVILPPAPQLDTEALQTTLDNPKAAPRDRAQAARKLSYLSRVKANQPTELQCLALGPHRVLHFPGELFVEYQLAAQEMWSEGQVFFTAYGDFGPGYIGTAKSYEEGGYETQLRVSSVAPEVEPLLLDATRRLLEPGK